MNFEEALESIGTTSGDVEGVKKRVGKGVVRRPIPSGYVTTKYKKKKKKDDEEDSEEKDQDKNEGRRMTRDKRPEYSGEWYKNHWSKGDNSVRKKSKKEIEKDKKKDKEEEELDELMMQLSGALDQMNMDPFWDKEDEKEQSSAERDRKKKKKLKKKDKKKKENGDKQDSEESDNVEEAYGGDRGGNIFVDPHYDKNAIEPFWRKGDHAKTHFPIDDIKNGEDTEEYDDDDEEYEYYPVDSEEDDEDETDDEETTDDGETTFHFKNQNTRG